MYETFFKLRIKPFELLPNPAFLLMSKSHKRALTYLDYGMRERAGFILVTGEVGSGKTTIVRELVKRNYENVIFSKIFNTHANFEQLMAMINDDFGLPVQGKDKIALMRDLNEFLIEQYALGNKPTLIIDEAQNLNAEILEEIRMLSNLETDRAKLLQIILVGQPELRNTLALPSLLQLRQRIGIFCHIQPLTRQEIEDYIYYRLEVAGNRKAVTFSAGSLDLVFRYSRGIPRLINIICDFLMLAAYAEELTELSEEMVTDVIGDLDFENQFWRSSEPISEVLDDARQPRSDSSHLQLSFLNEATGLLLSIAERLENVEKGLAENRQNLLSEIGRFMKVQQGNQTMLMEVGNMINSLKKELVSHHEETGRIGKAFTDVSNSLNEYVTLEKNGKAGLLKRILRAQ
jgi:putative secretion ATPase (PEP-CTERM system associated)